MSPDHGMLFEPAPGSQGSLPDSQSSCASIALTAASAIGAPRLLSTSSNMSTSTSADTQLTSPASSTGTFSQTHRGDAPLTPPKQKEVVPYSPKLEQNHEASARNYSVTASTTSSEEASTITSPISIEAPGLTQGSKRTASGAFKYSTGAMESPQRTIGRGHSRHMSLDSNTSSTSRIGELSAQLKTRLSYAMIKVQHGWERQSLDELEEQTSRRVSPIAASRSAERLRLSDSPQSYSRMRRASAYSDDPDQYLASPGSHTSPIGLSRSLNSTPPRFLTGNPIPGPASRNLQALSTSQTLQDSLNQNPAKVPALAPAAPIISRRPRRSNSTHAPPSLLSTQRAGQSHSDLGPGTKYPATPRAGILRMPSQQAEKDAVDTLLFMSSPKNSAYVAHSAGSTAQPSPLRTEFNLAPKRVVFEDDSTRSSASASRSSSHNGGPETTAKAPNIPQLAARLMAPPLIERQFPRQTPR